MNPRLLFAILIGLVVAIGVYVAEVVTPPPAMLIQDVSVAVVVGGVAFLAALVMKL